MIRHSSSLFLSFIVHSILLVLIFFAYKLLFSQTKEKLPEHRVCVELCHLEKAKPKVPPKKPEIKKQEKPKPKPKPKVKPKLKPKKVEKKIVKKELPKKVEVKKKILIVKEKVAEVIIPKAPKKPPVKIEEKVLLVEEVVEVETASQKSARLEKEYIDENILKIRELISDNLYYPRSARKRGIVGEVIVKFTLLKNAEVDEVSIVSSHSKILSRAAIRTIEELSKEFPKPRTILILHVPISYTLK